jgi:predicted nucleic acid-binding protein
MEHLKNSEELLKALGAARSARGVLQALLDAGNALEYLVDNQRSHDELVADVNRLTGLREQLKADNEKLKADIGDLTAVYARKVNLAEQQIGESIRKFQQSVKLAEADAAQKIQAGKTRLAEEVSKTDALIAEQQVKQDAVRINASNEIIMWQQKLADAKAAHAEFLKKIQV